MSEHERLAARLEAMREQVEGAKHRLVTPSELRLMACEDVPLLLAVAEAAAEYRRATEYLFAVEQTHYQEAAIDEAARIESEAYQTLCAALDALAGEAGE